MTQGAESVIVWTEKGCQKFEVQKLNENEIVDTNGAGDSFVGGFLSQLYLNKSIDQCVMAGCKLSREVVKRSGCTFPEDFNL